MGFPCDSVVNNPPANAGDTKDMSLIPGSERYPGEGNGNPLQYSCLGSPSLSTEFVNFVDKPSRNILMRITSLSILK